MFIILSPAKTLDYQSPLVTRQYTEPRLLQHSRQLIEICRQLSPQQIASLMHISDKLTGLNVARFSQWQPECTVDNARPAVLAFRGDVYQGLQAEQFNQEDFAFSQQHLGILSGLYGLLRPLDLMQPYRLEMGTRLENPRGRDLYAFWGDIITDTLNQAIGEQGDNILVNLASDEYFRAVQPQRLQATMIKPVFQDEKNGQYKVISFHAKHARGLMSRFIIRHRLTRPEQLTDFNLQGYRFAENHSSDTELVFRRAENAR